MDLKPELFISVATAQAIVECAGAGGRVVDVTRIHGGEIAAVYVVTCADAQPPLVLKVYPDSLHWKMRKEASVISLVTGRLRVPAPLVLMADDSKQILDLNFLLMSKLEGSILGHMERSLTPEAYTSAYVQIGQLLRDFHRIPMDAFGYIGGAGVVNAHPDNHAYLAHQFKRKLDEFAERGGAASLGERIAAHVAERNHLFTGCAGPVLCHNDLHAGNLLAKDADGAVHLTGVLDFEGALAGDPLFDVAKAMFYLREAEKRALLSGYGDTQRAHWRETLGLYHLYFVLELWCWMAQIGNTEPLEKLAGDLERSVAA